MELVSSNEEGDPEMQDHKQNALLSVILALATLTELSSVQAAMVLKLDSANFATVGSGESTQGVWTDSSGNGNNAVQTTWQRIPGIVEKATNSGATALQFGYFSGNTNSLALTNPLSSAAFTIALVAKPDASHTESMAPFGGATGAPALGFYKGSESLDCLYFQGVNDHAIGESAYVVDPAAFHVITVTAGGNQWAIRVDGAEIASGPLNGYSFPAGISCLGLGSLPQAQVFYGQMAAFYAYDTVLDMTTLHEVENALAAQYVIPEPASLVLLGLGVLVLRRRRV